MLPVAAWFVALALMVKLKVCEVAGGAVPAAMISTSRGSDSYKRAQ
jgi:hypothetical protein